jgi:uncharacterized protein YfaQ (DUF2300 family)
MLGSLVIVGAGAAEVPARQINVQPAEDCQRQPQLEVWLQAQVDRWHRSLVTQAGYERPEIVIVCRINRGNPYVDYDRNRIFLRSTAADEDRISLAHEYLHLAFKHHPVARDERFIESTARKLAASYPFEIEP